MLPIACIFSESALTTPYICMYTISFVYIIAPSDKPFHGGATPSRADITMFGVLRSISDYDVFSDLVANTRVALWYERMAAAVGPSSRIVS